MGAFFDNFHIRSDAAEAIADLARTVLSGPAAVSPARHGWTSLYDSDCEDQHPSTIGRIGRKLSHAAAAPVVAFVIHDSDILWAILFENGKKTGEYLAGAESDDAPPRGKALAKVKDLTARLAAIGTAGATAGDIRAVLAPQPASAGGEAEEAEEAEDGYLFAEDRARALAKLLGIDENRACFGYEDVIGDEGRRALGYDASWLSIHAADADHPTDAEDESPFAAIAGGETRPKPPAKRKARSPGAILDAIASQGEEGLAKLVSAGIDLDRADKETGETALLLACAESNVRAVALLIDAGAHVNARCALRHWLTSAVRNGVTPLMVATSDEIAGCLIEHGAELDAADAGGRTALMSTAAAGSVEVVRRLIAAGASTVRADTANETAASLALAGRKEAERKRLPREVAQFDAVIDLLG